MHDKDSIFETDEETENKPKFRFGVRHVQILLMFACLTISIAMRTNLSVAIVAMTDNQTSSNPNIPTYNWNNNSIILSSFFWGYVVLQIIAGYIAKTYGTKYLLLSTCFANTVAFFFIHLAAEYAGSIGVMTLRVIQGIAQGCLFPCAHTILGVWAPAKERSTMGIIVYSGLSCGSILSLILTGYLCSSWIGWPSSFYIFAGLGLIWCALFSKYGHNSPACHPSISEEERTYIEESLGQSGDDEELPIPWKSILTCIHFWAIVSANIGSAWGYTMMMTQIPTYLAKVMKFDIKSNGLVSAVPYMVGTITGLIFAPFADFIIHKELLSRVNARRIFQLAGSYGLVVCLMLLSYASKSQVASVVYLGMGNAAYSATLVGYSVNHVDLSPRFAGVMQGISNCISQIIAMFSPMIVHFIVTRAENASQWCIIFIIASVFYAICATIFAFFASATRQKWDGPESEESFDYTRRRPTILTIYSIPGFE